MNYGTLVQVDNGCARPVRLCEEASYAVKVSVGLGQLSIGISILVLHGLFNLVGDVLRAGCKLSGCLGLVGVTYLDVDYQHEDYAN